MNVTKNCREILNFFNNTNLKYTEETFKAVYSLRFNEYLSTQNFTHFVNLIQKEEPKEELIRKILVERARRHFNLSDLTDNEYNYEYLRKKYEITFIEKLKNTLFKVYFKNYNYYMTEATTLKSAVINAIITFELNNNYKSYFKNKGIYFDFIGANSFDDFSVHLEMELNNRNLYSKKTKININIFNHEEIVDFILSIYKSEKDKLKNAVEVKPLKSPITATWEFTVNKEDENNSINYFTDKERVSFYNRLNDRKQNDGLKDYLTLISEQLVKEYKEDLDNLKEETFISKSTNESF